MYPTAYTVETAPAECVVRSIFHPTYDYITVEIGDRSRETEARQFDAYDAKGRRFGAEVVTWTETRKAVPVPASGGYYTSKWTGVRYAARPGALRNGASYGATADARYFETEAERDAYIVKYFRDAEKRALKNKSRAR